jgi:ornithine cyclodeaminase/alanine dehydrogenase-like protein (mu-crystallin family)
MCAFLPESGALATKIVTVFPNNATRSLPLILGVALLNDPATGAPLAVIDGGSLTSLRTAAGSAVATRVLGPAAPRTLAIIGAGAQAQAHLSILCTQYQFADVRICARRFESAQRLAMDNAACVDGAIRAVATAEEAVHDADVVVTATTATEPVVRGIWLKAASHICAVGAARPQLRELDSDVIHRAMVVAVDTREGALTEAGDLIRPISEGVLSSDDVSELGEILLGTRPGRGDADGVTVYKSVGTAAMDAAVAAAIYIAARRQGAGVEVDLR